jgi:hypothetical protein
MTTLSKNLLRFMDIHLPSNPDKPRSPGLKSQANKDESGQKPRLKPGDLAKIVRFSLLPHSYSSGRTLRLNGYSRMLFIDNRQAQQ